MSGFIFKFQPVLNIRQQTEDVRKFEMAKSVSLLEDEREKLTMYKTTEDKYIQSMSVDVIGGMNLRKIRECNSYILHMRKVIDGQKQTVLDAEIHLEESRERLKTALVEKKTMEKLKSRHAKVYIQEQNKKEQLITDEITTYKYKMKASGD